MMVLLTAFCSAAAALSPSDHPVEMTGEDFELLCCALALMNEEMPVTSDRDVTIDDALDWISSLDADGKKRLSEYFKETHPLDLSGMPPGNG